MTANAAIRPSVPTTTTTVRSGSTAPPTALARFISWKATPLRPGCHRRIGEAPVQIRQRRRRSENPDLHVGRELGCVAAKASGGSLTSLGSAAKTCPSGSESPTRLQQPQGLRRAQRVEVPGADLRAPAGDR